MTATLNDQTDLKERPEPTAEAKAAAELVRAAREQGLSLTGPDRQLKQLTKTILETALNAELIDHLADEKHDGLVPGRATSATGPVEDAADRRSRSGRGRRRGCGALQAVGGRAVRM